MNTNPDNAIKVFVTQIGGLTIWKIKKLLRGYDVLITSYCWIRFYCISGRELCQCFFQGHGIRFGFTWIFCRYRDAAPETLLLLDQRCMEVTAELAVAEAKINAAADVASLRKASMMYTWSITRNTVSCTISHTCSFKEVLLWLSCGTDMMWVAVTDIYVESLKSHWSYFRVILDSRTRDHHIRCLQKFAMKFISLGKSQAPPPKLRVPTPFECSLKHKIFKWGETPYQNMSFWDTLRMTFWPYVSILQLFATSTINFMKVAGWTTWRSGQPRSCKVGSNISGGEKWEFIDQMARPGRGCWTSQCKSKALRRSCFRTRPARVQVCRLLYGEPTCFTGAGSIEVSYLMF